MKATVQICFELLLFKVGVLVLSNISDDLLQDINGVLQRKTNVKINLLFLHQRLRKLNENSKQEANTSNRLSSQ